MGPGATAPPPDLLARLKARYAEPQRAYHTWTHIEALLGLFARHIELVHNRTAVLWAIFWHDVVYDPRGSDNEEISAQLLRADAASLISPNDLQLGEALILATRTHTIPSALAGMDARDCGVFLDLDLSILAAPEATFDAYEAQIRIEYAHVSDELFRAGRRAILKTFLERPALFFTPELARLWDAPARKNLTRSIRNLSS